MGEAEIIRGLRVLAGEDGWLRRPGASKCSAAALALRLTPILGWRPGPRAVAAVLQAGGLLPDRRGDGYGWPAADICRALEPGGELAEAESWMTEEV